MTEHTVIFDHRLVASMYVPHITDSLVEGLALVQGFWKTIRHGYVYMIFLVAPIYFYTTPIFSFAIDFDGVVFL